MKRALLALLALALLAAGAIALCVDRIAGAAIERGATRALGVETRVGFVHISPFDGGLRISSLRVANPPGFEADHFLAFDSFELQAELASLRADVVHVPLFLLEGVDLSLERQGTRTNTDAIFDSLKRFESGRGGRAESRSEDPERRFAVSRLLIRDVTAHVEWSLLAAKQSALLVHVEEIDLASPGGERGLTLPELSNLVVKAVLDSVRRSGQLPVEVARELSGGLRELARLPVSVTGGVLEQAGAALGDAVREAGEALQRGLDDVLAPREEPAQR